MPAGFRRHLVGKTLRNLCRCDIAKIRAVGKLRHFRKQKDWILFKLHHKSSLLNCTDYAVLYPQNGDRIMVIVSRPSIPWHHVILCIPMDLFRGELQSSSVQFARRERVLILGCLCKRIGVHAGVVGRDCARRGSRDMTTPTEGHVIELDAMTSSTADRALTGYDVITNDAIQVDTAHKS